MRFHKYPCIPLMTPDHEKGNHDHPSQRFTNNRPSKCISHIFSCPDLCKINPCKHAYVTAEIDRIELWYCCRHYIPTNLRSRTFIGLGLLRCRAPSPSVPQHPSLQTHGAPGIKLSPSHDETHHFQNPCAPNLHTLTSKQGMLQKKSRHLGVGGSQLGRLWRRGQLSLGLELELTRSLRAIDLGHQ